TDNACTGPGTLAARRFNPVMPSAVRLSKGPYLALIAEELGRSRRRSRVAGRYNLVLCPACASREPVRSACTGGSSGPYSTKVQQPTWIPEDSCGRPEMVTCTDVLLWTSCHCMACKRSGVRVSVAPQEMPGQSMVSGPSGSLPRSSDRHLTVAVDVIPWH